MAAERTHALLAPSSGAKWYHCAASVWAESHIAESHIAEAPSDAADEGTFLHAIAADMLLGRPVLDRSATADQALLVQTYVDYVRTLGGTLRVEQRLDISEITGEKDAKGTADAVVLSGTTLYIVDAKFGRTKVEARSNIQLIVYALAAYMQTTLLQDVEALVMVIVQPRLDRIDAWYIDVAELLSWQKPLLDAAKKALWFYRALNAEPEKYVPGEKQCRWCKASSTCTAFAQHALNLVADDFIDLTQPLEPQLEHVAARTYDTAMLGNARTAVPLVEMWCKAVTKQVQDTLHAGESVPGWKLALGNPGNRAWTDPGEAEAALKAARLKVADMYDQKVVSPTTAGKLHKAGTIKPRAWSKLQALITRPEGKPVVVRDDDPRPAINPADDFANIG